MPNNDQVPIGRHIKNRYSLDNSVAPTMSEQEQKSSLRARPPPPTEAVVEEARQQELDTAAAFLSISGPCFQPGNVYLACVATAGLGMCRHLRAAFEQCAKANKEESLSKLHFIGQQQCPPDHSDKPHCAARMILKHYMPKEQQP